jgi:hypothetical protein
MNEILFTVGTCPDIDRWILIVVSNDPSKECVSF